MAYLFTHFTEDKTGDREAIWFALSYDGLHWKDLGGDTPFLTAELGTKGIRDPFIVYDEKLKKYFIIATDLFAKPGNWYNYTRKGSRSIFIWESEDLVNWSKERLVEVAIDRAGCVWAPEAVYCKEKDAWFVFWASCVREKGALHRKQRIYGSFTKDFKEFTPAFKYIDAETDVIDTNIVWDKGCYYRFSKDESNKYITTEKSADLLSDNWEKIHSDVFADFMGLEGPETYFIDEIGKWCLIADQYHTHKGYTPFLCDDLSTGNFEQLSEDKFNMGKRKKRHGGVIKITDEQAEALVKHLGISE